MLAATIFVGVLAGCASAPGQRSGSQAANPHYKVGQPYKIGGRWYVPKVDKAYDEKGVASWYGDAFHGKLTANGEIFDKNRLSAAHKTLPLPTYVEVENLENGRKLVVRVNDRGPFVDDRVIDLSHAAADELGFTHKGLARVRVRYLGDAEVSAIAALPGDKARRRLAMASDRPAQPRLQPAAPAIAANMEADGPGVGYPDPMAALIATETTPQLKPATPATADMWLEVAAVDDLNKLESLKLNLPELGPISVRTESGQTTRHWLRAGPFTDETIALSLLTRVQAAGFGGARLVRSYGG
ncbi:MAG: septal ring lytic transglycosylase RlpA family protein [Parvularculaceae bacterium]|nr:septal ring lytic transglycosylase RlpA family protein [Parvularculaceae bacterium]